jgi:hypothetical protein
MRKLLSTIAPTVINTSMVKGRCIIMLKSPTNANRFVYRRREGIIA